MVGLVVVCDINKLHREAKQLASSIDPQRIYKRFYLVAHKLKVIENPTTYETDCFAVHKFDLETTRWIKVTDLGDRALLVRSNTSFSLSTLAYREFRRNAIYNTDSHTIFVHRREQTDIGVYSYEDHTSSQIYSGTDAFLLFRGHYFFAATFQCT